MYEVNMILQNSQLSLEEKGLALDKLEKQIIKEIRDAERTNVNTYRYCPQCDKPYPKGDFQLKQKMILNPYKLTWGQRNDETRTEYVKIYTLICPTGHQIDQDRDYAGYYIDRIGGDDIDEVLADFSSNSQ